MRSFRILMDELRIHVAQWTVLDWLLHLSALVALVVWLSSLSSAHAQGMHHNHGTHIEHHGKVIDPKLHDWYSKLQRPDMPSGHSCCSNRDCVQVQARWDEKAREWSFLKGDRWVKVPQSKINREESYDSQAHACWYPWSETDDILCFVKPGPGI